MSELEPLARRADGRPLRVLHAPVNVAGGPGALSAGMRKLGVESTMLVFADHRFQLGYDINLGLRQGGGKRDLPFNLPRQFRALAWALPRFDVFHFHFTHTLVPKKINLPLLRALRKPVVFHFWGSDIRDQPASKFAYLRYADAAILGSLATVDRAPEAPAGAGWPPYDVLPIALDIANWKTHLPDGDAKRPLRLVHAPSKRSVKGTDAVLAAVASLQARGVPVELDLVENVPHDEARRRYESADVIVDQFVVGWYGVFAIESMALGKPVVCNVDPEGGRRFGEMFGHDLPIVHATKETLEATLEDLARDRSRLPELGRLGRSYVETVHEQVAVARRGLEIYAHARARRSTR